MISQKKISIKFTENLIVIAIWLLVFALPLTILKQNNYINWNEVLRVWQTIFPFFLLFLINHYILVPFLLFKAKRITYFVIATLLVSLLLTNDIIDFKANQNVRIENNRPFDRNQRSFDPQNDKRPLPPRNQNFQRPPNKQLPPPNHPKGLPPFLNSVLFALFVFGFDTGLRISLRWAESEKQKSVLEKENIQNQLAFLKHQVSPHFFMNTLNNIHSLIDIDTEEAKASVIKLSKLMRYLLYDTEGGKVLISKEVEFIKSYVNLMKLRYSEKVKIELKISESIPEKKVHPLLFISLIENAFKHGISYQEESFVLIEMALTQSNILFEIQNSTPKHKNQTESSGVGMDNTRKRLNLLYADSYLLNVSEADNIYKVSLTIPI